METNMLKLAKKIMELQEEVKTYTVQQAHTVWYEIEVQADNEVEAVSVARELIEAGQGVNISDANWEAEPRDVFWVMESKPDGEPFYMKEDGTIIEGEI